MPGLQPERALEAERVGHPPDHEVHAGAGEHVHGGRHAQVLQQQLVLLPYAADVDARRRGARAIQKRRRRL